MRPWEMDDLTAKEWESILRRIEQKRKAQDGPFS